MGGHDDLDFVEYDPTPYGGGYDQARTYGESLPPSRKTCYPLSDHDANDDPHSSNSPYDQNFSSDAHPPPPPPYDFYPGYGNWFDNLPSSDYHNKEDEDGFGFSLGDYGYGTIKPEVEQEEEPAYGNFCPGYGYGYGNEELAHGYGWPIPETPQPAATAGYDRDYNPDQIWNPYGYDCFSDWPRPPSPGQSAHQRLGYATTSPWKGAEEYLFGRSWDDCGETRDEMPRYENHRHAHAHPYATLKSGHEHQHIENAEFSWFERTSYYQHHYQQEGFSRSQYADDFYEEKLEFSDPKHDDYCCYDG